MLYMYMYLLHVVEIYMHVFPQLRGVYSCAIAFSPFIGLSRPAVLDAAVQKYYMAGLAPSAHKTYQSAGHHYLEFCASFSLLLLPTSEATLCYHAACLGQQGLAEASIWTT